MLGIVLNDEKVFRYVVLELAIRECLNIKFELEVFKARIFMVFR